MKKLIVTGSRINGKYKITVLTPNVNGTGEKILKAEWPKEKKNDKKD